MVEVLQKLPGLAMKLPLSVSYKFSLVARMFMEPLSAAACVAIQHLTLSLCFPAAGRAH